MYNDGDNLQYIEQNSTESYFTVRSYPSALNKKVGPGARSPCLGGTPVGLLPACWGLLAAWVLGRNTCEWGSPPLCRLPLAPRADTGSSDCF